MITTKSFIEQINDISRGSNYIKQLALTPFLVALHNCYCITTSHMADYIYDNEPDTINWLFEGKTPYDMLIDSLFASYHPSDDYFIITDEGHIQTLTPTYIAKNMLEWEAWLEDEYGTMGDISHISEVRAIVLHFNLMED